MSITILFDEETTALLESIARENRLSVEDLAQLAIKQYAQQRATLRKRKYSFIGIGHSNKTDLSERVEDILADGANREEGWSLR